LRHAGLGIAGSSISRAKTLRLWIHPAPSSGRCFNMVADGSSSTSGHSLTRRNLVAELIATRLSAARAGGIIDRRPASRRATRSYPRARGLLLELRSVACLDPHASKRHAAVPRWMSWRCSIAMRALLYASDRTEITKVGTVVRRRDERAVLAAVQRRHRRNPGAFND
jgi:hypothetical protein